LLKKIFVIFFVFCFFIMDKSKGESSLENSYPQDSYLEDYYKTFGLNLSYYREYEMEEDIPTMYPMCVGYLNKKIAVYREYDFSRFFYLVLIDGVDFKAKQIYNIPDFYNLTPFVFKTFYNNNLTNSNQNYKNLSSLNYYVLIDYLIDSYKMYSFAIDKETDEYALFSAFFINSKDDGSFFPKMEIVFSKKFNHPVKIIFFDYNKKSIIELRYLDFYENGSIYSYKKVEILIKETKKKYSFMVKKNLLDVSLNEEEDFLIKISEYFKIFRIKTVYE
jgi:hypothetical protein